jgi:hypothetical protein
LKPSGINLLNKHLSIDLNAAFIVVKFGKLGQSIYLNTYLAPNFMPHRVYIVSQSNTIISIFI